MEDWSVLGLLIDWKKAVRWREYSRCNAGKMHCMFNDECKDVCLMTNVRIHPCNLQEIAGL